MKSQIVKLSLICVLASLGVACQTASRSTQVIVPAEVVQQEVIAHTKTSIAIRLPKVDVEERSVYFNVSNHADKVVGLTKLLREMLAERGYKVAESAKQAHFVMQVKVLQIGKNDEPDFEAAFAQGYGKGITRKQKRSPDQTTSSANTTSNMDYWLEKTEAEAKDSLSSMIVDVDIVKSDVRRRSPHYQTRVISGVDQKIEDFKQIQTALEKSIVKSIARMFPKYVTEEVVTDNPQ